MKWKDSGLTVTSPTALSAVGRPHAGSFLRHAERRRGRQCLP
jgi:hypothetical protein